ncbi:MAG TPA: sulfotransferase, partial [Phycisphaerales bacterium]|nr:sulfotransferase [Phycisphaerales bacterium]
MGGTWRTRLPIALPGGHFMGLAPLDVWARLLWACRFRIGPRYWVRLATAVATSVLATAITLPERVLLWPWLAWRFQGRDARFVPRRDVVVLLGYFRSGTTHLHNLLATHPDVVTPRWVQAMSPQGFRLSWAFLGWALVPFLPNTRPQDGVAFGPDWPAEDDFAHNNWALASSLPGRLVLVRERERWGRFDSFEGLTERELGRWRRAAAAFAWKVSVGRGGRTLALKSPSHTGRVRELDRLFGGRVRFVHIMRRPEDVVRSNVAMHRRLEGQSLQAMPADEVLRERIVAEYVEAERRFLRDARELGLGPDRLVRMRYESLVSAP